MLCSVCVSQRLQCELLLLAGAARRTTECCIVGFYCHLPCRFFLLLHRVQICLVLLLMLLCVFWFGLLDAWWCVVRMNSYRALYSLIQYSLAVAAAAARNTVSMENPYSKSNQLVGTMLRYSTQHTQYTKSNIRYRVIAVVALSIPLALAHRILWRWLCFAFSFDTTEMQYGIAHGFDVTTKTERPHAYMYDFVVFHFGSAGARVPSICLSAMLLLLLVSFTGSPIHAQVPFMVPYAFTIYLFRFVTRAARL